MMSRSRILPSLSSSRQMMIAWKVSGLSHRPAIIASRPASMRLAMAISPSRESSSTEPISRRYMRTGSSVRSAGSELRVATAVERLASTISPPSASSSSAEPSAASFSASSASSLSTTLMPISLSIAFMSSIWSEEISSDGSTAFNSSCVTQPRFLATFSIRLTAASLRSRRGLSAVSAAAASPSTFGSSFFAIGCLRPPAAGAGFRFSGGPPRKAARPGSIFAGARRGTGGEAEASLDVGGPPENLASPGPSHPGQIVDEARPDCSPKPSIAASACARSARCALMSSNRAKFCSFGSAASDRSASFSSLFNAPAR